MAYTDPSEAIVGVLQASGIAGIDWTPGKSPYQIEAAEPLPEVPWPFVVFMIPDSSLTHVMGANPWVEEFTPTFWVVGSQKQRKTILAPWKEGGVIPYLDSLRGTDSLPNGFLAFNCEDTAQCSGFYRNSYRMYQDPTRGEAGQRIFVAEARYTLRFNLG